MPRHAALSSLALLALVLGGCGGGTTTTPHFAAKADAICARTNAEVDALAKPGSSLASLAAEAASEVPIVRAEITQLAALTAPSSERAEYAKALATAREEAALTAQLIAAVRADNHARIASLALQINTIDTRARLTTTALGLNTCAEAGQPSGQ